MPTKQAISRTLTDEIIRHRRLGRRNYAAAFLAMLVIVGSTAAAAISGLLFDASGRIVGALALLPGLVALAASSLKLQTRSIYHYRCVRGYQALRSKLDFVLPEEPSRAELAELDREIHRFTVAMDDEFDRTCGFDFTAFAQPSQLSSPASTPAPEKERHP